ncbi:MAG: ABC transporter transmembrane domain-containing protein, partial [Limnochordia bacterium]
MSRFGGPGGFGPDGGGLRSSYRGMPSTDVEPKSDISWQEVQRVLIYLQPYKWQIGLVLFSIGIGSLLSLVPPQLIRAIIDKALPQGNARLLNLLSLASVALAMGTALLDVGRTYLITWISQRIMLDLRAQLYERLAHMTLRF